jgi:hypothetical protein
MTKVIPGLLLIALTLAAALWTGVAAFRPEPRFTVKPADPESPRDPYEGLLESPEW